jgi:sulfonate transport system substrate-binding protein
MSSPISRRSFNALTLAALAQLSLPSYVKANTTQFRIGFQKSASLLNLLKAQGTLEKELAKRNVEVKWVEFPAGPQLLEGLNVGSIDFGYVGEAPPIFAQAAGANFVYIGYEAAAPSAEAIVVPKNSEIKNITDLKGKKIALNKGSNVHYLLVKLLEKNGLKYSDIQPIVLPPADARAAFERGSVDAWVIWDPFLAAAEKQLGAKIISNGKATVNNYCFFLASKGYAQQNQKTIELVFDELSKQGKWIVKNYKGAAQALSTLQGLDTNVLELSLERYSHDVRPITADVLVEQQKIADSFFELKLIPKAINVKDATVGLAK